MVQLFVKNKNIAPRSGIVELATSGTVDCMISKDNLRFIATRQLPYDGWYSSFILSKSAKMVTGGGLDTDDYLPERRDDEGDIIYYYQFPTGLTGGYFKPTDVELNGERFTAAYLKTIQQVDPDNAGNFWILPGKTVDVSEKEEGFIENPATGESKPIYSLQISTPIHHLQPHKRYVELDLILWRLYHCICSLIGRLRIYNPALKVDGYASTTNMGPYLGTYLQYQALVARWNHYAWASAFTLDVEVVNECANIVLGYTNLNCKENRPFKMAVTITQSAVGCNLGKSLEKLQNEYAEATDKEKFPKWANPNYCTEAHGDPDDGKEWRLHFSGAPLTIYRQGFDSTLDEEGVYVRTRLFRHGEEVAGYGYEGKEPEEDSKYAVDDDKSVGTSINDRVTDGSHYAATVEFTPGRRYEIREVTNDNGDVSLKFVDTEYQDPLTGVTGVKDYEPDADWTSMRPEQRYRAILSVAPCIGSDKELTTQEGDPLIGIELQIRAIWMFDSEIFEKTATATVHAVNVKEDCVEEDIQNYNPLQGN